MAHAAPAVGITEEGTQPTASLGEPDMHATLLIQPSSSAAEQSAENGNDHEHSAVPPLHSKQAHAAPEAEGPEASGGCLTADPARMRLATSAAESAEPVQAPVAAAPDQQVSAGICSEPASAAAVSQSRPAETPAAEERVPLRPDEMRVAAALLVVLQRAQKEGRGAMAAMKELLMSNDPRTSLFLQVLPEDGMLPSVKQLEASSALQEWLLSTFELCISAECQPLELYTRRTLCGTHLRATHSVGSTEFAARQQRLQAIETSLAVSSASESREDEILRTLHDRVELLAQYDVALKSRALIAALLRETITMLKLDREQLRASPVLMIAGAETSFTVCIDHMLPGEGAEPTRATMLRICCMSGYARLPCLKNVRGLMSMRSSKLK